MSEDLNKINDALKSENEVLKGIIDQLSAQKDALSQTVNDILQANVNLKSGTILLEKQIIKLNHQLTDKDNTIKKLTPVPYEPDIHVVA